MSESTFLETWKLNKSCNNQETLNLKKKKKSQIYIKELCGILTYSGPIPQPQLINGLEQQPMFPVQVLVLEGGE